jgi:transcription termination factor Rho
MPIINAEDLEASPLADLHELASTLAIDGYRRLRKPELVEAILARQGEDGGAADAADDGSSRGGRSRRRRGRARDADPGEEAAPAAESRRPAAAEPQLVEGAVELLANGSGFVRPDGASGTESDVYISAAQARRCELVSGDRVSGPVRPPRRSERHPSLIRIDTINGVPADEAVHGTRIDDIEVDWPVARFPLAGDQLLEQIDTAAPFGGGSRVIISGPSRSGKTQTLGKLASALGSLDKYEVELVAVGVRPEELSEYRALPFTAAAGTSFAASRDAHDAAVEQAIERGRRVAVRGGEAVVLLDTLDALSDAAARRALAAARNLRGAGSLTVIATAREPLGGETTVVALAGGALDAASSGTLRSELLAAAKPKRAAAKPRATRARSPRAKPKADGAPEA